MSLTVLLFDDRIRFTSGSSEKHNQSSKAEMYREPLDLTTDRGSNIPAPELGCLSSVGRPTA
jgi:hypothetical protein